MRDENMWPELDADAQGDPPPEPATERTEQLHRVADDPSHSAQDARSPLVAETTPDTETTQWIPLGQADTTEVHRPLSEQTTVVNRPAIAEQTKWQRFNRNFEEAEHDEQPTTRLDETPRRKRRRKPVLIGAALFGLLAVLYVGDLLLSSGRVPRGVTVAGVAVGGLSPQAAEDKLRAELESRLTQPVRLAAGQAHTQLEPESSGLAMDWAGTLEQAGDQPLNPITRISSFFTTREVGVVSKVDRQTLATALHDRRGELDAEPREGTIAFDPADGDRVTARAVPPRPGQQLDVNAAVNTVAANWLQPMPVELPVTRQPVKTTEQGVRTALEKVAKPAVAEPLVVRGDGAEATLQPVDIAHALSFVPADGGGLRMKIDNAKVRESAQPQLAGTEVDGEDAKVDFSSGAPVVRPGTEGRAVDWKKTLKPMPEALAEQGDKRRIKAHYTTKPPDVTTKDVRKLGIKEVIGEFTTSGFAADSGENIRQVAEEVDGAIVKPGKTFSLNDYTGPRTEAQGYVEAGIIEDGVPSRAVGGGISQFATTLYNATYFAGLKDAGHQEHSYYISRYPAAREATVYQADDGEIDLAFTNNAPTGIAIQTIWTPSDITVKIWGTKRYRVESIAGDKTNFVPPPTQRGPAGECEPSEGVAGFTTSDTRVLYDVNSGAEVGRNTRTVTYNPEPKIICR